jgi:hypothetical protein
MHYGYVGRAAGFSLPELVWGSNAAQEADTGTGDTPVDEMAVREGFLLHKKTDGRWVSFYDLLTITSDHAPSRASDGWGEVRRYTKD